MESSVDRRTFVKRTAAAALLTAACTDDEITGLASAVKAPAILTPGFPQVASSATSQKTGAGTSHPVTMPTGIASGDLLLAFVSVNNNGGTTTISWPGDWTEVFNEDVAFGVRFACARKIAAGGNSLSFDTNEDRQSAHIVYRITGYHATTIVDVALLSQGEGPTPDPPSFNPPDWDVEDTLWIAAAACYTGNGQTFNDDPTGYPTNYAGNQRTSQIAASGGAGLSAATRELATASENPGTFTLTGSQFWAAATVAVRPGSSGGGGGVEFLISSRWDNQGATLTQILDSSKWAYTAGNVVEHMRVVAGTSGCPTPNMLEVFYVASDDENTPYCDINLDTGETLAVGETFTWRFYLNTVDTGNFIRSDHHIAWQSGTTGNGEVPWIGSDLTATDWLPQWFVDGEFNGDKYVVGGDANTAPHMNKAEWHRWEVQITRLTSTTDSWKCRIWDTDDTTILFDHDDWKQDSRWGGDGVTKMSSVAFDSTAVTGYNPSRMDIGTGGFNLDPSADGIAYQFAAFACVRGAGVGAYDSVRGW